MTTPTRADRDRMARAQSLFAAKQWQRIYIALGPDAERLVAENPYRLRQLKFKIEQLDIVAAKLGIPKTDPRRCVAIAEEVLDEAVRAGDCYVLLETVRIKAGFPSAAAAAERLAEVAVVEGKYVYPKRLHAAETHVAEWFRSRRRT